MSFFAFAWYAACALFWLALLVIAAALVVGVLGIAGAAIDAHDQDPNDDYKG